MRLFLGSVVCVLGPIMAGDQIFPTKNAGQVTVAERHNGVVLLVEQPRPEPFNPDEVPIPCDCCEAELSVQQTRLLARRLLELANRLERRQAQK